MGGDTVTRRQAVLGEAIPGVTSGDGERVIGEILIRGSSMMSGYVGDAPHDPENCFRTGDLGSLMDGGLVVCGRAKEIITIAGRSIFPAEVERVAATIRGVREGAVVAVGIGERSIRPGLAVVAECGVVPADVTFVRPGSLPRTTSGKLRRLEVRRSVDSAPA